MAEERPGLRAEPAPHDRGRFGPAAILFLGVLGSAGPAAAHAFAQRYDLPLPLWFYLVGAGATVAVSVPVVAWTAGRGAPSAHRRQPHGGEPGLGRVLRHPAIRDAIRVLAVGLFVLLITAGLVGPQGDPVDNLLPTAVWVIWWVGLAYVSAFVGDVWRAINPWAIIGAWTGALWRRFGPGRARVASDPLPWLAAWPAALLFLAFGWAELVWPSNAVPAKLASAILIYSAITWTGMAIFGVQIWLRRGEAFALFFGLFARFAPIEPQTLAIRPYGVGLLDERAVSTSMLGFVVLALALVSFDGIAETPLWAELTSAVLAALHRIDLLAMLGYVAAGSLVKTAGLVLTPLAFLGVYLAVCRLSVALVGAGGASATTNRVGAWTTMEVARRFVLTLVPIAIAYHLAHYLSYLLIHGQEIIRLASDPLGLGWNLFGTAARRTDIAIVGARFVWITSVVAIVLGHVAALWLAHVIALRSFGPLALRSQYPMIVLMVGYTMLSLWILAQPIAES